jgi:hypothetical protein
MRAHVAYWNEASLEKAAVGGSIPSLWSYRRLGVKSQEKSTSYKGPYNAISGGAEHFRNSTLNLEELMHRFHSGADGVLRVKMQFRVDSANWPMKAKFSLHRAPPLVGRRRCALRVSLETTNIYAETDLVMKAKALVAYDIGTRRKPPKRRWRDLNQ